MSASMMQGYSAVNIFLVLVSYLDKHSAHIMYISEHKFLALLDPLRPAGQKGHTG